MESSAPRQTKLASERRPRLRALLPILALCFGSALCADRPVEVSNMDPRISREAGKLLLLGEPFTGVLRQSIPAVAEKHRTPYADGLKDGVAVAHHDSGRLIATRSYVAGQKHGVHRTWYNDGTDKSYAEFDRDRYIRESLGWHPNGRPSEFKKYTDEGVVLAVKRWRDNGLIYMNLVLQEGQGIGVPGSKVCNPTSATNAIAKPGAREG
ncbi:MAG: hypothetical protein RIF32_18945 [Leptospirales bacterium]